MTSTRAAYERISEENALPTPTGVAKELVRLSADKDTNINEITGLVERDPATSGRLLKLVNSPLAGMPRRIASVRRAVALLGMRTVTSTAIGFSLIKQCRQGPCKGFDYQRFWSGTVAMAVSSGKIAKILNHVPADEAFTCGLLCRVGTLSLSVAFPSVYTEILDAAGEDEQTLLALEREKFEIDHDNLSAELMVDWGLPDIFSEAVRNMGVKVDVHERPGRITETLRLAKGLSNILHAGASAIHIDPEVMASAFKLNFHLAQHYEAIREEWKTCGDIFEIKVPSAASAEDLGLGTLAPACADSVQPGS